MLAHHAMSRHQPNDAERITRITSPRRSGRHSQLSSRLPGHPDYEPAPIHDSLRPEIQKQFTIGNCNERSKRIAA